MKSISASLEQVFQPRPPLEGEYYSPSDGLLYCAKCDTPKQTQITLCGKVLAAPIMCQCQRAQADAAQAELKYQQKALAVARLKSSGLHDRTLRDYTFAHDNGLTPELEKAKAYVANWHEARQNAMGLLLWGNVGTGKSFFAGCVANALIEQGVPVLMTNFSKILNSLTGLFSNDKNKLIDSFNEFELLIIDDFGIERNSEFVLEQVFNIIDSRYRSKKPMIITTNLTLAELKHPQDIAHARIYDRLLERCVPLCINGQNIRQMNSSENFKLAQNLLAPAQTQPAPNRVS